MENKEVRFGFGENWATFVAHVDDVRIREAEKSLRELLKVGRLDGKTLVDIGSGSGLFSLAARRLCARVHSFDFDPASVASTASLKAQYFADDAQWMVEQGSVLDRDYLRRLGQFDVVYSWGVLHHTGALHRAIQGAASCVKPGGLFAFSLYRKTPLCLPWTVEKRWYAKASATTQARARALYVALMRAAFLFTGRSFGAYIDDYRLRRGMSFEHDVHDWLGGYPYESVSQSEVQKRMTALRFRRMWSTPKRISIGLFGTGCDEYLYERLGDGAAG